MHEVLYPVRHSVSHSWRNLSFGRHGSPWYIVAYGNLLRCIFEQFGQSIMYVDCYWNKEKKHWFAAVFEDDHDEMVDYSSHPKFPIDVNKYSKDQADELMDALCEVFPDAGIFVRKPNV